MQIATKSNELRAIAIPRFLKRFKITLNANYATNIDQNFVRFIFYNLKEEKNIPQKKAFVRCRYVTISNSLLSLPSKLV